MAEGKCRETAKELIQYYCALQQLETMWMLQADTERLANALLRQADQLTATVQTKDQVKAMLSAVIKGDVVPLSQFPARLAALDYKTTLDSFLDDAMGTILSCSNEP